MKKAIYFTQEVNSKMAPSYQTCLVYDEAEGLKLIDNRKEVSISTSSDAAQTNEIQVLSNKIAELEKTISIMKVDNAGGIIETDTIVTVTTVSGNILSPEKDVTIYSETPVEKATTIEGKNVFIEGFEVVANNSNATLTIDSTESIEIKDLEVTGAFASNSNTIDITKSNKIVLKDTTLASSGYNGIMFTQYVVRDGKDAPEEIIIDNVNFTGELSLATLNICATADNANVEIKNCNFGKTKYAIRFRNGSNATGVNVLIENCHFDECVFEKGNLIILFEENESVSYIAPNGETKVDAIWAAARDFASAAGVVIEEDSKGKITSNGIKSVFPYLLEFEDKENRFGKNKMTITFRNCTYGAENTPLKYAIDEYKNIIGTNAEGELIGIFRQSGRTTFNPWNENFPTESSMLSFPYDDETKSYMETFEEITWTQTNKNSDCYPTIIFE